MASSNTKMVATMILMSLALFAFASANAAVCPGLDVCLTVANDLVNVAFGAKKTTPCCALIDGLLAAEVKACLCDVLRTTGLGSVLATAQGLTYSLPIVGGLLPGLLPSLIPYNILNADLYVLINACGLEGTKYICPAY